MHPEVREEQAYFDRALELRGRVEANLTRAANEATDPRTARDLRRQVGALGVVDPSVAVAFGRIDVDGSRWYIGKGAIWDENNELVVVNWQAPVAAPFYRATPEHPEGLDARRIYRCASGNRIRDIDEHVFVGLQQRLLGGAGQPAGQSGSVPEVPAPPASVPEQRSPTSRGTPTTGPVAVPPAAPPSARPTPASGSVAVVRSPAPGSLTAPGSSNGAGSHHSVEHNGAAVPGSSNGAGATVPIRHTGPVDVAFGSGAGASAFKGEPTPPSGVTGVPSGSGPTQVVSPAAAQSGQAGSPQGPSGSGPAQIVSHQRSSELPVSREPLVSDALLEALGRSRSGELAEIVTTIQAAQYEVITRDIEQLLVVQGGPGTGKTVVGLHRASWMLYTRRDSWQPNDVLVVGPNPAFIRYIASVLPSLGDDAVVQLPVTRLGPRVEVTRTDPIEVRRLKGDRRLQRLVLRAVRNRQKPQRGPVDLTVAGRTVRLDGARVVTQAQQLTGQPHNEARRALREFIIDEVQTFFTRRGLRGLSGTDDAAHAEATREIDDYLERIWPAMTPQKFLVDLFSTRRRLDAAGVGLLSSDELAMLALPPDVTPSDVAWAVDDVPLLDLADTLLNGSPPTYEHIVVDEAQDLSPMQFESIRRRSRTGWMTVLGDLAQATSPWSPESWEEIVLHLRHDRVPTEIVELSIGYRLPREVHELAMRLLPEVGPRLRVPEAVRMSGNQVRVLAAHVGDVAWRVVEEVDHLLSDVGMATPAAPGEAEHDGGGLTGVIVPERHREAVARALDDAGLRWVPELPADGAAAARDGLPVVLLAATEAKGLEFDNVIVVEPGEVAGESPQGLRALFVALTRTTNRLSLVHAEPLPSVLEIDSRLPDEPTEHSPSGSSRSPWEPVGPANPPAVGPAGALSAPVTPPSGVPTSSGAVAAPGTPSGALAPQHAAPAGAAPAVSEAAPRHGVGSPDHRAGATPSGLEALDRSMARAVAGQLADTLVRYVTPSLVPLVLEELGAELAERAHGDVQVLDVRDR